MPLHICFFLLDNEEQLLQNNVTSAFSSSLDDAKVPDWKHASDEFGNPRLQCASAGRSKDSKGAGVFPTACRINHSCLPNCHFSWSSQEAKLVSVWDFCPALGLFLKLVMRTFTSK